MRTVIPFLIVFLSLTSITYAQSKPETITGQLVRVADVNHPVPGWKNVKVRDEKGIIRWNRDKVENDEYEPPVLFPGKKSADVTTPAAKSDHAVAINGNFPGMAYTYVCPADPSLAVGDSLIVQMINGGSGAYFSVYRKSSTSANVNIAVNQKYLDQITGKGGLGDPVALFDPFTKYFILTEFANKSETGSDGLIIAVVKESEIQKANSFKSYFFPTSSFPDYPKFGINNGYLYGKTNDFKGNSYAGASAYMVNLASLYNGNTTVSMTRFSMGKSNKYYSMCPVNMVGKTKPAFSQGGLFAYLNPRSWSGLSTDQIGFVELNPLTGTWSDLGSKTINNFSFSASRATQPDNGEGLDALIYRVMNHPVARTFLGFQKIVVCFTVDNGINSKQSFRWVEFKIPNQSTSNSSNFSVSKQSTFAPTDNVTARFQPSANIDKNGRIGIVYNITNSSTNNTKKYPSVWAVGIDSSSTPLYTTNEGAIANGTATSSCGGRYGDYNHLVIDPADSIRFWATGMYNSTSQWSTAIGNFTIGPSSVTVNAISKPVTTAVENSKETIVPDLVKSLFPNPATDAVNITLNSADPQTRLQIIDLNGEVIREVTVPGTVLQLNTKLLAPGAYLLRITQHGKVGYQKFIKQ